MDPGREARALADPVADARALVEHRFPAAGAAFLGGGVLSARRTATSDLDIVVVLEGHGPSHRESLTWRGWPVELFVQHTGTVDAWFAKDRARRRASLARMCTEGEILADSGGLAEAVRERARAVIAAGPPPPEATELDRRRYGLSDLLDDLRGSTDPSETVVICWNVVVEAAELALLLAGSWFGSGKWLLRELRAAEPELADELIAAREEPGRLARAAEGVLARAGGRLWEGYYQAGTA
jgi:hypothetical protein